MYHDAYNEPTIRAPFEDVADPLGVGCPRHVQSLLWQVTEDVLEIPVLSRAKGIWPFICMTGCQTGVQLFVIKPSPSVIVCKPSSLLWAFQKLNDSFPKFLYMPIIDRLVPTNMSNRAVPNPSIYQPGFRSPHCNPHPYQLVGFLRLLK